MSLVLFSIKHFRFLNGCFDVITILFPVMAPGPMCHHQTTRRWHNCKTARNIYIHSLALEGNEKTTIIMILDFVLHPSHVTVTHTNDQDTITRIKTTTSVFLLFACFAIFVATVKPEERVLFLFLGLKVISLAG